MLKQTKKPWSLLIYIAADNNLSDAGLEDIRELCEVGASEHTNVGVEIDTIGEHTGSIRYEITEPDWTNEAHRTVIQRLPERDTGDPATLRDFLVWGTQRYEADKRLVVVWNHGAGFRAPRRDIAYDDYGSSLDMPDIISAFDQANIGPDNKIAVLGFDACLMSMLEIANHMYDHVEYLVGSQETEPGDGWPYDQVLKEANADPTAVQLAAKIVDVYIESYAKIGIGNVTQSAVDVAKTEAAAEALNTFGAALADRAEPAMELMRRVRLQSQSYHMADYVDLTHVCQLAESLGDQDDLKQAAHGVIEAVGGCVVHKGNLGSTVSNSNGLSVWFPHVQHIYFANRPKYLALRCNSPESGWVRFLDAFHGA